MKYRLLAALALILPLAVACSSGSAAGGDPKSPEDARRDLEAALQEAAASPYEFEASIDVAGPEVGEFALTAEGTVDATSERMRASADLGELIAAMAAKMGEDGTDASGSADAASGDGLAAMLGMLGASDVEVILDGTTAYVRSPLIPLFAPEAAGTDWVAIDLTQQFDGAMAEGDAMAEGGGAGDGAGVEDFFAPQSMLQSPASILPLLNQVTDLTEAGSDEVRGVEATRWDATLNVEDLVALAESDPDSDLSPEHLDALRAYTESLSDHVSEIPVSLWLDGDDRLRRVTLDVTATDESGAESTAAVDLELFAYDEDAEITVPDAADVTELSVPVRPDVPAR